MIHPVAQQWQWHSQQPSSSLALDQNDLLPNFYRLLL